MLHCFSGISSGSQGRRTCWRDGTPIEDRQKANMFCYGLKRLVCFFFFCFCMGGKIWKSSNKEILFWKATTRSSTQTAKDGVYFQVTWYRVQIGLLLNIRSGSNQFSLVGMPVGLHRHEGFNSWLMGKLQLYWEFFLFLCVRWESCLRSKRKHFLAKLDHARLTLIRCAQLYPKCQRDHLTRDFCSPSRLGISALPSVVVKRPEKASGARTQPGAITANSVVPRSTDLCLVIGGHLKPPPLTNCASSGCRIHHG